MLHFYFILINHYPLWSNSPVTCLNLYRQFGQFVLDMEAFVYIECLIQKLVRPNYARVKTMLKGKKCSEIHWCDLCDEWSKNWWHSVTRVLLTDEHNSSMMYVCMSCTVASNHTSIHPLYVIIKWRKSSVLFMFLKICFVLTCGFLFFFLVITPLLSLLLVSHFIGLFYRTLIEASALELKHRTRKFSTKFWHIFISSQVIFV